MFPWQEDFDSLAFRTLYFFFFFLPFVKKCIIITINLDFLFILIIFESIWTVFWGLGHEIKKSKMANSRWWLGRIKCVIATSCDLIVPFFWALKETVWPYNLPSRFHCHSVNAWTDEGGWNKVPLRFRNLKKKKNRLNSVCKIISRTVLSSQFKRLPFVSFQLHWVQVKLQIKIECALCLTFRPALFFLL